MNQVEVSRSERKTLKENKRCLSKCGLNKHFFIKNVTKWFT